MAYSDDTKGKLYATLGQTAASEVISHAEGADALTDFGVTASAAELNILDGVTATAAELNLNDLSAVGALVKIKKIAISADFGNTAQDSGWDIPLNAIVLDVFVKVTTADAGETLDVGTSIAEGGFPNGFLDGISVNDVGIHRGTAVATVGSNNTYLGAANTHTIGALLTGLLITGEDTAAGGDGVLFRAPSVDQGGLSLVYTGSAATNTMRGAIYILYIELAA